MKRNGMIRFLCGMLAAILMAAPVLAASPTLDLGIESYVFNRRGSSFHATPAPMPYRWVGSITAEDIGVDNISMLGEIKYQSGRFFIINASSLIITDNDFNHITTLTGMMVDGEFINFGPLEGIFVTHTGELYITDPNPGRIWHLDREFNFIRVLGRPDNIPAAGAHWNYHPTKVAVDHHGRIYVIARGVHEGLMELNPDGSFNRYLGTVPIRFSAAQIFWRALQTQQQRARALLVLSTQFSNLTVDRHGFIYATVFEGPDGTPVMRLNARGQNILRSPYDDLMPGDLNFNHFGMGSQLVPVGPSILNFIQVTDFGVMYVFDTNRNRLFAYDYDGHMLFAFGGTGQRIGHTQIAVGMTMASDNRLIIADRQTRTLEVFERTAYGIYVMEAARLQFNADWEGAAQYWRRVLHYNPYFQFAYLGVGRYLYRHGRADEAVHYFQMAQNVAYFSRAFSDVRSQFMADQFDTIVFGGAGLIVLYIVYRNVKKYRRAAKQKRGALA